MTFSAILAYGYDLEGTPRFTGDAMPVWWNPEQDATTNLVARLTAEVDPGSPDCGTDHSDELDDTIGGVFLTLYGSDGSPRHLLGVRGFLASDWEAEAIPGLEVPACADQHLAWAARVLDLKAADTGPAWHLAAEYF